ncbi:MAG: TauD/TfdA family dioxygenase [Bacteroidota bacterium]
MNSTLHIENVSPNLGVYVEDINPNTHLDSETIETLKKLINTHHLVLLKSKEPIQLERQVALTKQLGDAWNYDYISGQYKEYPEIFKVTNQQGNGFVNAGQAWHSDGSVYNRPMHLSIFSIGAIPHEGAATYFSNLNYAYERLPDDVKRKLSTLEGDFGKMYKPHPVIWKHPVTDLDVLHVSEGFQDGFIDTNTALEIPQEESEEIQQFLHDHMWAKDTYYEHQWSFGDLVIADNYAVAHYAKPTHSNTLRVLHRTATKGQKRHQLRKVAHTL